SPSLSSGSRRPTRSSPASSDFACEPLRQDTRARVRGLRRAIRVLPADAGSGKGGLSTMISTGQILAAGLVTALGVGIAGWTVRWPRGPLLMASASALALILAWRGACNLLGLNGDFLPAVSIGDTGCLVVGALAPLAT